MLELSFPPIRVTCTTFYGRQNSRFKRQFRTKNTIQTIRYTTYKQPKSSSKFKEIDSVHDNDDDVDDDDDDVYGDSDDDNDDDDDFIREGEGAELACIAGGSPQPNITWTRRVRSTILR